MVARYSYYRQRTHVFNINNIPTDQWPISLERPFIGMWVFTFAADVIFCFPQLYYNVLHFKLVILYKYSVYMCFSFKWLCFTVVLVCRPIWEGIINNIHKFLVYFCHYLIQFRLWWAAVTLWCLYYCSCLTTVRPWARTHIYSVRKY